MGVQDIRLPAQHLGQLQGSAGKKDITVVIVHKSDVIHTVDTVTAIKSLMFQKIDRHLALGQAPFPDPAVHLADDSHRHHQGAG